MLHSRAFHLKLRPELRWKEMWSNPNSLWWISVLHVFFHIRTISFSLPCLLFQNVSPILSNFNPDVAASPKSSPQKVSPATAAAASELSTSGTQCEQDILQSTSPGKPMVPTRLRIGFLGLGIMGQGMVMNLLLSGHEVMVWNRSPVKVSYSLPFFHLEGTRDSLLLFFLIFFLIQLIILNVHSRHR